MSNFWFGYWWPSIKGNGPEDLTSLLILALITSVLYPPLRKWWHDREQAVHAKLEHNAKLLGHIIEHHPDIPNEDRNGNLLVSPRPEPPKKAPVKKAAARKASPK